MGALDQVTARQVDQDKALEKLVALPRAVSKTATVNDGTEDK